MNWIDFEKQNPRCTETGNWDGKRSSLCAAEYNKGGFAVGYFYQGFMDGSDFFDFVSEDGSECLFAEAIKQYIELPNP
jgi:hypothetical protein